MIKKILLLFIIIISLSSGFSYSELFNYNFEEGAGTIILDTSGSSNFGTTSGGSWDTTLTKKTLGSYSYKFTNDDNIKVISSFNNINSVTLTGSIFIENENDKNTIIRFYNSTNTPILDLSYWKNTLNYFMIGYIDNNNVYQVINVPDTSYLDNTLHTFAFIKDYENNKLMLYVDDVLKLNQSVTFKDLNDNTFNIILAQENSLTNGFKGNFDNFKLFDFAITDYDDITTLLEGGVYEVPQDDNGQTSNDSTQNITYIFNNTMEYDIIKSFTPLNNTNQTNYINFEIVNNINANCDLYINNNHINTFYNKVSNSFYEYLDFGDYEYFYYCWFINDDILYYEISDNIKFNVQRLYNSTIGFTIEGVDYNPQQESLYIVTPCPEKSLNAGDLTKNLNTILNEGEEFYIQALNSNNYAQFDLTPNTYEFCLVNGMLQYDTNGFTTDYNINSMLGMVKIGEFNVPSNVTESYILKTDLMDIYDNYNPKAFGLTWAGIIGGFILFIIGLFLSVVGLITKSKGAVAMGGLMILSAFGVSVSGIILGAIF